MSNIDTENTNQSSQEKGQNLSSNLQATGTASSSISSPVEGAASTTTSKADDFISLRPGGSFFGGSSTGGISLRPGSSFFGPKTSTFPSSTSGGITVTASATGQRSTSVTSPHKDDRGGDGTRSKDSYSKQQKQKDKDGRGSSFNTATATRSDIADIGAGGDFPFSSRQNFEYASPSYGGSGQTPDNEDEWEEGIIERTADLSDVDHMKYDKPFLLRVRKQCLDCPEDLQLVFADHPELLRNAAAISRVPGGIPPGFSADDRKKNQPGQPRTKPPGQGGQARQAKGQQGASGRSQPAEQLPNRTANPWNPRPSFLTDEKDQVLRTIVGKLNRLTPENFPTLSVKLCEIIARITDEQTYREAVALVFDKAVSEPNFSKMYSQLCVRLNEQKSKFTDKSQSFRRVLLNRCQDEFEQNQLPPLEQLPSDPEELQVIKDKMKRKKLGNVKFIGELFKQKLLSERIIHECIKGLFDDIQKQRDDKELMEAYSELLCKLMTTIGKLIDTPLAKEYMDAYFRRIKGLSADQAFSARLRFKFQDLLELRASQWVPRREENAPKKIAEVHADAAAKQFADELEAVMATSMSTTTGGGSTGSSLTGTPTVAKKTPGGSTDEWQTQPAKKGKGKKGGKGTKSQTQTTLDISEPKYVDSITSPNRYAQATSVEEVEQNINNVLQEFFLNTDMKETASSLQEVLKGTDYYYKIIEVGISNTLEKKEKEREALSKLFGHLYQQKILSEYQFTKGLKTMVDSLSDWEVDIPNASKLVARFLANALSDKCISLNSLENNVGLPGKLKQFLTEMLEAKK